MLVNNQEEKNEREPWWSERFVCLFVSMIETNPLLLKIFDKIRSQLSVLYAVTVITNIIETNVKRLSHSEAF